ncbi:DUF2637 domain-containing protein [Streptomyces sp. NPDC047022]|uniref:DUF2637 domain-containing protein n=1 Tax=Streptomyces sp. NPDC047022 TaxID=3155737 RepID=UPI0033D03674
MNGVQIRSAEKALSVGTWLIVAGAMLYSILTVTPLAASHTPSRWAWTAPILPLVVDAAVVIVVRLDAVLARLGGQGGRWPIVLRWMTGCMTLALNVADSALKNDLVGVAVHSVAPLLLIVTAETGLAYRRAITAAVNALQARQQAERDAREQAASQRREEAARLAREQREHAAALAREEREHAAVLAREQREHEARMAREQAERDDRMRREERERVQALEREERQERERVEREREQVQAEREHQARQAREQAEREQRERTERERRERQEREEQAARERAALLSAGPATGKQPEDVARAIVHAAYVEGLSVRAAAELCGWSVGWVSSRYAALRDPSVGGAELAIASR